VPNLHLAQYSAQYGGSSTFIYAAAAAAAAAANYITLSAVM
jgi:hypothetical protein